jgi:preprotein translocase subunit YajC
MLLIFVIFYFLLIRPQQKRLKAHQAMLGAVKRNDVVVTSGGLIGKVTRVDDAEVEVELAANVRVRVVKSMLAEVRDGGGKPANDQLPETGSTASPRWKGKRASSDAGGPDLTKSGDRSPLND